MPISTLPTAPARSDDPATFIARADAFIAALPTFVSELNVFAASLNTLATTSTSTTSLPIGTGSKSLTVDTGKSYQVGMTVKIAYTTDPTKWMLGDVTSYNSGTGALVVMVSSTQASGTFSAWTISQSSTGGATLGSNTFTGAQNWAQGADIASASTINLDTATGNLVDITGVATITAITLAQGAGRVVRFTGAATLTNGASLVLPGGANIVTAAGDFAVFMGYASGVVRCVGYTRAADQFVVSASANGYQKLPSGLIVQWGTSTCGASNPTSVTFPLAFPNNVFGVFPTPLAGTAGYQAQVVLNTSNMIGFTWSAFFAASGGIVMNAATTAQVANTWFAIGN